MDALGLMQKRLDAYLNLKENLHQQQQALVRNSYSEVNEITEQQLAILERIQEIESSWQNFIKETRLASSKPKVPVETLMRHLLPDRAFVQYHEMARELIQITKDIQELKRTNQLLMQTSLDFVRTMLRNLPGGANAQAVYRPGKKSLIPNRLINTKL